MLLTFIALLSCINPATAATNSWNTFYCRINAGVSYINMNYSGSDELTTRLRDGYPYSTPAYYTDYTVAKNSNSIGGFLETQAGISWETSNNFGILIEGGTLLGGGSEFWRNNHPIMRNFTLGVGPFFYQPSYRIFTLIGLGLGIGDIFGYPSVLDDLNNGKKVSYRPEEGLLNANCGFFGKAAIGIDYKLTNSIMLGIQYNYYRSMRASYIRDNESLYIGAHNIGIFFGVNQ